MLKIGVKFCGGCNPRFDRAALFREAQERYKDIAVFEPAKEEVTYDRLLVICGCSSACAGFGHLHYREKPIMVWEEGHIALLKSLPAEEKDK
jgi:4-hydroxybutyrate CoA-transferase